MGIFDLTKVEKAIQNFRPTFVFVMDTNVLMNTPDPTAWKVEGNSALFIVSDTTINELEYIKRKTQSSQKLEDKETYEKAQALVHNFADLTKKGQIADGIQIPGGRVITVASPTHNLLQQELDKVDEIVKAFGRSDAKMLLLTKECNQLFGPNLVMLITGEVNLNNIAQLHGISCHLQARFPISGLKMPEKKLSALDWDKELLAIQRTIKETWVAIKLTLTSKSCGSDRLGKPIVVAEGSGVIGEVPDISSFFWTMQFHVGRFNERANAGSAASLGIEFDSDIPSATLDFATEKKPSHYLCEAIIEKLLECVDRAGSTEGDLSLQPPDEVLRYIAEAELFDQAMRHPLSEKEQEEIMNSIDFEKPFTWLDWISDMKEDEKADFMSLVYQCVHGYWKMGQAYEFRVFV